MCRYSFFQPCHPPALTTAADTPEPNPRHTPSPRPAERSARNRGRGCGPGWRREKVWSRSTRREWRNNCRSSVHGRTPQARGCLQVQWGTRRAKLLDPQWRAQRSLNTVSSNTQVLFCMLTLHTETELFHKNHQILPDFMASWNDLGLQFSPQMFNGFVQAGQ